MAVLSIQPLPSPYHPWKQKIPSSSLLCSEPYSSSFPRRSLLCPGAASLNRLPCGPFRPLVFLIPAPLGELVVANEWHSLERAGSGERAEGPFLHPYFQSCQHPGYSRDHFGFPFSSAFYRQKVSGLVSDFWMEPVSFETYLGRSREYPIGLEESEESCLPLEEWDFDHRLSGGNSQRGWPGERI